MTTTDYTADNNGIIRDPGKFEGEPIWVPHFWDIYLCGGADCDESTEGGELSFNVTEEDEREFGGYLTVGRTVKLWEDANGYVYSRIVDTDGDDIVLSGQKGY